MLGQHAEVISFCLRQFRPDTKYSGGCLHGFKRSGVHTTNRRSFELQHTGIYWPFILWYRPWSANDNRWYIQEVFAIDSVLYGLRGILGSECIGLTNHHIIEPADLTCMVAPGQAEKVHICRRQSWGLLDFLHFWCLFKPPLPSPCSEFLNLLIDFTALTIQHLPLGT